MSDDGDLSGVDRLIIARAEIELAGERLAALAQRDRTDRDTDDAG